jgi:opacity protein-like surface antigen
MKKIGLLAVCLIGFVTVSFAQGEDIKHKGEKGVSSVGGIVGYAIDNKTAVIGVDYRYNIKDRIRLAPSVLYAAENEYKTTLYMNVDAHYLVRITDKMTIYPAGGLGLSLWNFDYEKGVETYSDMEPTVKTSETKIRLGLNLGFGGEMRITRDIIVGAEFKYNLTTERAYDQAMILTRVAYYF